MPITIAKDAGAGAGSDTTYTINNFQNLIIEGDNPGDAIADVVGDEEAAILLKFIGPTMKISFDYTLDGNNSNTAGSLTALTELAYIYDTFLSQGTAQILDEYTLTVNFSGAGTFVRVGVITKATATMAEMKPLTFSGHIEFLVGDVN